MGNVEIWRGIIIDEYLIRESKYASVGTLRCITSRYRRMRVRIPVSVTCTRDEEHAYSVTADSVPISQVEGVDMEIRVGSEKMTYGEVGLGDHKVLAKGSVGS